MPVRYGPWWLLAHRAGQHTHPRGPVRPPCATACATTSARRRQARRRQLEAGDSDSSRSAPSRSAPTTTARPGHRPTRRALRRRARPHHRRDLASRSPESATASVLREEHGLLHQVGRGVAPAQWADVVGTDPPRRARPRRATELLDGTRNQPDERGSSSRSLQDDVRVRLRDVQHTRGPAPRVAPRRTRRYSSNPLRPPPLVHNAETRLRTSRDPMYATATAVAPAARAVRRAVLGSSPSTAWPSARVGAGFRALTSCAWTHPLSGLPPPSRWSR